VSVKTVGTGDGGTLTVTAKEAVLITGQLHEGQPSSLKSETDSDLKDIDSPGNGGSIIVSTPLLEVLDQGIITASSSGTGNAGNIKITSPGYLHLSNSEITTSVSANNGNGGNITLDPEFIILDNSYIKANAFEGKGGVINITTTGIYNFSGEPIKDIITAKSEVEGLDGLVTINSPDIDISKSLTQILPKTFLDAASLLKNKQCARRSRLKLSSLSIIRGDVVPKDPMDLRNHSMQLAAPGFKPCHVFNAPHPNYRPL
jgi:large exoprotein involved in heme utilization and adhesion